ncbi:MAG: PRC-barrel domain-containing protein [Candidatus Kariarchaeaceae archaeon]|jgi:sporulation protein YlmC with PRC-barrel domain
MSILGIQTDFGKLKKFKVFDSDDNEIGSVIDIVFDNQFNLSKFILGGSFIEELKEKIGLKADDDPVVPINTISGRSGGKENQLKLKIQGEDLYSKLDPKAISKDEYVYSKLSKYQVLSKNGEKLGKIVDALIDKNDLVSFVLGDSSLVEFLERIGLMGDYDLLVPPSCISSIKEKSIKKLLLKNEEIKNHEILNYSTIAKTKGQAHVSRYTRK